MENDSNGQIIVWTGGRCVKGYTGVVSSTGYTVMLHSVQSVETMLDSPETIPVY